MKYFAISCFFALFVLKSIAQTPSNDPTWQQVWSDEFNTPGKPNSSTWLKSNSWGPDISATVSQTGDGYNTNVNDSFLSITGKKGPHTDYYINGAGDTVRYTSDYTEGNIETGEQFRYGYFEARVRMPDSYNTALYGGWFDNSFWLYGADSDSSIAHSELDFEIVTGGNPYPNLMECNVHMEKPYGIDNAFKYYFPSLGTYDDPSHFASMKVDAYPYTNYFNKFQSNNLVFDHNWHIFGYEWLPDQIKFYLDNKLWFRLEGNYPYSYTDIYGYPQVLYPIADLNLPMNIFLGVGMDGGSLSASGVDSFSYDVDYVRYYTLAENCALSFTQTGSGSTYYLSDPGHYSQQVYNTVTLGQTGCPTCDVEVGTYLGSDTKITVRAQSIFLEDGFKVTGDTQFYAHDIDQCPYFIY